MSPILVRPVREQIEHDRIIRLLQSKSRRRHDAGINPGNEQNVPLGTGSGAVFPDLVLHSLERGRRVEAIVEVETGESVNRLEALAEWAHFARLRVPFHLYVPTGMADVARQLCQDNHVAVAEMWSYQTIGDDVRFALLHRSKQPVSAPLRGRAEKSADRAAPTRRKPAAAARAASTAKRNIGKRRPAAKPTVARKAATRMPAPRPTRPVVRPAKSAASNRKAAQLKKAAPVKKAATEKKAILTKKKAERPKKRK